MSTGFVKLYGSIIHSSIWNEPDNVRLVWVTMLAMSTYHGIVEASVGGIAHASRVSKESCEDALARLQAPDPDSRDGSTGERIRRIAGGWEIINHARYRDMRSPRQVKQAEYQRRYEQRMKGAQAEQSEKPEPQVRLSPSLSLSPSASQKGEPERVKSAVTRPDDVPEDLWREWLEFRRAKRAPVTKLVLDTTRAKATAAGMSMREALTNWIANGQTGFYPTTGQRPAPGSKLGQPVAEHPRGMPIPFDSPLSPCHCPMCKAARERKGAAKARSADGAVDGGKEIDRGTGEAPGPLHEEQKE